MYVRQDEWHHAIFPWHANPKWLRYEGLTMRLRPGSEPHEKNVQRVYRIVTVRSKPHAERPPASIVRRWDLGQAASASFSFGTIALRCTDITGIPAHGKRIKHASDSYPNHHSACPCITTRFSASTKDRRMAANSSIMTDAYRCGYCPLHHHVPGLKVSFEKTCFQVAQSQNEERGIYISSLCLGYARHNNTIRRVSRPTWRHRGGTLVPTPT